MRGDFFLVTKFLIQCQIIKEGTAYCRKQVTLLKVVPKGRLNFSRARFAGKIKWVLACLCLRNLRNCLHARILNKIFSIDGNFRKSYLEGFFGTEIS